MKSVEIKTVGDVSGRVLLRSLLVAAPGGINYDQFGARVRVIRALDKSDGQTVYLEDADYNTLVAAIRGGAYGLATPEAYEITEAALAGKEAPVIVDRKPAVETAFVEEN